VVFTDFIFDFFAVHFGEGKIAEDASEILSIDVSRVAAVVEGEGIFDLIFLNRTTDTIS
jgi:hypothetical protein